MTASSPQGRWPLPPPSRRPWHCWRGPTPGFPAWGPVKGPAATAQCLSWSPPSAGKKGRLQRRLPDLLVCGLSGGGCGLGRTAHLKRPQPLPGRAAVEGSQGPQGPAGAWLEAPRRLVTWYPSPNPGPSAPCHKMTVTPKANLPAPTRQLGKPQKVSDSYRSWE